MDVFGGSPASRLDKRIVDISEKFTEEIDSHVILIEINNTKIAALDEKCTKELSLHANLIETNYKKMSTLNEEARVNKMKIVHLESAFVSIVDKYFLENNIKIADSINSVEIINKNIVELKAALAQTNAGILILEKRIADVLIVN